MPILSFTIQAQQQNNWCWAGCAVSVAKFYNAASSWTQCSIANSTLGRADCCGSGASSGCNIPWYLDKALSTVGLFLRSEERAIFNTLHVRQPCVYSVGIKPGACVSSFAHDLHL